MTPRGESVAPAQAASRMAGGLRHSQSYTHQTDRATTDCAMPTDPTLAAVFGSMVQ
jgi:hypothetical protein